jgi:hypothetical protein
MSNLRTSNIGPTTPQAAPAAPGPAVSPAERSTPPSHHQLGYIQVSLGGQHGAISLVPSPLPHLPTSISTAWTNVLTNTQNFLISTEFHL